MPVANSLRRKDRPVACPMRVSRIGTRAVCRYDRTRHALSAPAPGWDRGVLLGARASPALAVARAARLSKGSPAPAS